MRLQPVIFMILGIVTCSGLLANQGDQALIRENNQIADQLHNLEYMGDAFWNQKDSRVLSRAELPEPSKSDFVVLGLTGEQWYGKSTNFNAGEQTMFCLFTEDVDIAGSIAYNRSISDLLSPIIYNNGFSIQNPDYRRFSPYLGCVFSSGYLSGEEKSFLNLPHDRFDQELLEQVRLLAGHTEEAVLAPSIVLIQKEFVPLFDRFLENMMALSRRMGMKVQEMAAATQYEVLGEISYSELSAATNADKAKASELTEKFDKRREGISNGVETGYVAFTGSWPTDFFRDDEEEASAKYYADYTTCFDPWISNHPESYGIANKLLDDSESFLEKSLALQDWPSYRRYAGALDPELFSPAYKMRFIKDNGSWLSAISASVAQYHNPPENCDIFVSHTNQMSRLLDDIKSAIDSFEYLRFTPVLEYARYMPDLKYWRHLATDRDDPQAQYRLGELYDQGEQVDESVSEAVKWYRMAADRGNVDAQIAMANAYSSARGVQKNFSNAAYWWRLAAEQGDLKAIYNLGYMYEIGLGVSKDIEQAIRLQQHAADGGFAEAQYSLGMLHMQGKGVDRDFEKAASYFNKASEQGHIQALEIGSTLESFENLKNTRWSISGLGCDMNGGTYMEYGKNFTIGEQMTSHGQPISPDVAGNHEFTIGPNGITLYSRVYAPELLQDMASGRPGILESARVKRIFRVRAGNLHISSVIEQLDLNALASRNQVRYETTTEQTVREPCP